MKRGLAVLDPTEVPPEEFDERVEALRTHAREEGLDAVLVYGDVYRSDDVAYLTNLTLYWNETVLLVPLEGDAVLLTKLSPRVHGWMHTTARLAEVRSGKDLAQMIATYASEAGLEKLGINEYDIWPGQVIDRLGELAPTIKLVPGDSRVRVTRSELSEASDTLMTRAGTGLGAALRAVGEESSVTAESAFSTLDRVARRAEFVDVQVENDPGPSGGVAVRVAGQYRYLWVAAARTWGGDAATTDLARQAVDAAADVLRPGIESAAVRAAAARVLEALPDGTTWRVRTVDHADLSSMGDVPTSAGLDELPIKLGSVLALFVELRHHDGTRTVVGDTYRVGSDGPQTLTGPTA